MKVVTLALSALVAAAAIGATAVNTAEAKPTVFACAAEGDVDISMEARYAVRPDKNRRKFNTEFEAAPRLGYAAGQKMTVLVDGKLAGTKALRLAANGDFTAELELDSRVEVGHVPFPKGLVVKKGSKIAVRFKGKGTVLSCTLK